MKFLFSIVLLASIAAAAPAPVAVPAPAPVLVPAPATVDLEQRQSSNTRNELEQGSASNCPDGILIFARGSTEGGNIVSPSTGQKAYTSTYSV